MNWNRKRVEGIPNQGAPKQPVLSEEPNPPLW